MDEKEEFSFMEEEVMESKKPQRKFVAGMKKSICFGAVFGVTAGVCFAVVSGILAKQVNSNQELIALKTSTSPSQEAEATSTPKIKKEKVPVSKEISTEEMQNFYRSLGKQVEQYNVSIAGISTYSEETGMEEIPVSEEQIAGAIIAKTDKYVMLLTNYAAINDGKKIQVTFRDGITVGGSIYNADTRLNLAIVKVALSELPTGTKDRVKVMGFSESSSLGIGDVFLALGSPNGSLYSMEFGYITSQCSVRNVEDYQMDVYTTDMRYYSNGYGVVCNVSGEVVGIINSQNTDGVAGCFFGISKLKLIIENLLNQKEQVYAGVVAKEIPATILSKYSLQSGIYVTEIADSSPAYDGGILVGDVISKVNEEPVKDVVGFYHLLQKYKAGDKVKMTVIRNPFGEAQEKTVHVKLTKRN